MDGVQRTRMMPGVTGGRHADLFRCSSASSLFHRSIRPSPCSCCCVCLQDLEKVLPELLTTLVKDGADCKSSLSDQQALAKQLAGASITSWCVR